MERQGPLTATAQTLSSTSAQAMRRSVPALPWVLRSGVEVSVNGFVCDSGLRPESSQRQAVQ
jgi:hypothetical protein